MKTSIFFAVAVFLATVDCIPNFKKKFRDSKQDNSVFDKILEINQRASRSRAGGPRSKVFQGDIVVTDVVRKVMAGRKRGAQNNPLKLWPSVNGRREVPYIIDYSASYLSSIITGAMREWQQKVPCIRFVPRSYQRDYLRFYAGQGCSSAVGRQGGGQYVSLGNGCGHHGIAVHEIGHALGFWHEQSRPDRDNFINIYWRNIAQNMRYNFDKNYGINSLGVPYDYGSIMHYGPKAFSVNGQYTMLAKNGQTIGQQHGLSASDVKQAKLLYKCGSTPTTPTTPTTTQTTPTGCTQDQDKYCPTWASGGYCKDSKHQSWMAVNCKKSCCRDENINCRYWAGIGECSKNPAYMLTYCIRSCLCKC